MDEDMKILPKVDLGITEEQRVSIAQEVARWHELRMRTAFDNLDKELGRAKTYSDVVSAFDNFVNTWNRNREDEVPKKTCQKCGETYYFSSCLGKENICSNCC